MERPAFETSEVFEENDYEFRDVYRSFLRVALDTWSILGLCMQ